MPDKTNETVIATVMEQLMAGGPQVMAERGQFLSAGHFERAAERRGYANGTKPKLIDTLAGTLSLDVPKTAGTDKPYYPQALERGRRSCRAVILAVAERYVCVRRLDPRCRAGHGRVRLEKPVIDPGQPRRQAAR